MLCWSIQSNNPGSHVTHEGVIPINKYVKNLMMTSQTTYEGVHKFIYTKNPSATIGGPYVHTTQKINHNHRVRKTIELNSNLWKIPSIQNSSNGYQQNRNIEYGRVQLIELALFQINLLTGSGFTTR